ncbi:hypothetical protein Tco_0318488 [Tanacetum coccineum]
MKKPTENPKSRTNNGCTGPRGEDYQKQADEEENFKEFDSLIAYVLETSLPQPQTQLDSTRPAGTCSGSPSSLKKNVFILDHVLVLRMLLEFKFDSEESNRYSTWNKTLTKPDLPEKLSSIHNTFHVSNLKKCLSDESLVIPMKELQLDDKLNFVEEPVEVMDREIKQLKRSRIPIIKVRWNSKRGPEFTWEREDEIRAKYPHLFSIITSSSIKSRDEISVRGGDYNNPQFS